MIPLPAGVRVWLGTGYTDMRKGFPSLALQVQDILHRDPLGGHLFCFRGRRGNHSTFSIRFASRDDRLSVASLLRDDASDLAQSTRQETEDHPYRSETWLFARVAGLDVGPKLLRRNGRRISASQHRGPERTCDVAGVSW